MRWIAASLLGLTATAVSPAPAPRELALVRGDLQERVVLTGELDAVSAQNLTVPRTQQWVIQLRWLEVDGTPVKAGQKVAEFDNSAFVADLSEKKLAAVRAANDLERQREQNAIATADKTFDVEKAKNAVQAAHLQAAVDKDSLPARVWQENQLDLERQQTAYAKAKDDLESQQKSAALDVQVKQIALEKSQREIHEAEAAVQALELRAPRDGVVVIANHPREGRKLEVGDALWVGLPVVRLPDLSTMRVKAWLSDVDEGAVAAGMKARCTIDAHADEPFEGTITEISPVARVPSQKSQRRAFEVTVELSQAQKQRLLPGLSVKVEVAGRKVEGAMLAPRSSLDLGAKPARLHRADGEDVEVDVGLCDAQRCEVKAHGADATGELASGMRLRSGKGTL